MTETGARLGVFLTTTMLTTPVLAAAEDEAAAMSVVELSDSSYLLQVLLSLVLVLGTIFLLSYLVRKFELTPASKEGPIKILHSVGIGGKEQLLLVQVGQEQVLLGRSPGHIATVHQLKEPVTTEGSANTEPVMAGMFAKILNREM